jgi:IclR family acetate operon transcriptional repressor
MIGRRQGALILYLDVIESAQTLRYSAGVGEMKPLHSSAIGKAFLGRLEAGERAAQIARLALDRHTPNTIVQRATLEADLGDGAAVGYFITRGENVVDVMGLATTAEIFGDVFGIAIAAPLSRMESDVSTQSSRLLAARDRLEALGQVL